MHAANHMALGCFTVAAGGQASELQGGLYSFTKVLLLLLGEKNPHISEVLEELSILFCCPFETALEVWSEETVSSTPPWKFGICFFILFSLKKQELTPTHNSLLV